MKKEKNFPYLYILKIKAMDIYWEEILGTNKGPECINSMPINVKEKSLHVKSICMTFTEIICHSQN